MFRAIVIATSAILWSSAGFGLGEWCGSRQHGDLNKLVPDSFKPERITITYAICGYVPGGPSANFRPSCRNHDQCYWNSAVERRECDRRFRASLDGACKETYHKNKHKKHKSCCMKAAYIYEQAVINMGGDSYRAAQKEAREAADIYKERTGIYPDDKTRARIAELCMENNGAGGVCETRRVIDIILK